MNERRLKMYWSVKKMTERGQLMIRIMDEMMTEDVRLDLIQTLYSKLERHSNDLWKECMDEFKEVRENEKKWRKKWSKEAEQSWKKMESS